MFVWVFRFILGRTTESYLSRMKKVVVERFSSYIELTVNKVCILLVGGLVWKMITNKLFCTKGTFSLETECGWCCWCWYSLKGGNSRVVVVGKSGIF